VCSGWDTALLLSVSTLIYITCHNNTPFGI
jgi:hypothetical protein